MKKAAKVGVIGAGGIAKNVHLPSLAEIENANVVALCDLVEDKAKTLAEKYSIPHTYWNMYDMFEKEELDCVFVLVEPDRLWRAASDTMKHGLPLIMEKPAGSSAHQTRSLARYSEETGVTCAVAMNRRHIPVVQEVKRIMNEITPITQVDGCFMKYTDLEKDWRYMCAFDCDGIHALDLVRYLAGSEVDKCACLTGRFFNSSVDNAWSGIMHFENGITGTIRSNYQAGARFHQFEMHGPKASAFINLGMGGNECEATIITRDNAGSMYSLAAGGVGGINRIHLDGKELAKTDKFYAFYGYKQEDMNFINSVLEGTKPLCTVADAANSMELCEKLHASSI